MAHPKIRNGADQDRHPVKHLLETEEMRRRAPVPAASTRSGFGMFVVFADDHADGDGGVRIEIDELKAGILLVRKAEARVHADLHVLRGLMDGETVNLVVVTVGFVRLHHEAAAGQLPQHTGLAASGVQDEHLRLMRDVHALKLAPFFRFLLFYRLGHGIISLNALTGSISTGTSLIFARADFNSDGMESYFLNHCSARFLSPVASISSSSLARVAIAPGILA